MRPLTLILAFLPLIAFSLLTRFLPHDDIGIAGLVTAVIALIVIVTSRPIWPPKIIITCSLVLFAVLAVLGFGPRRPSRRSTACSAPGGAWPSSPWASPGSPPRPSAVACLSCCSAWSSRL
jgi:hypothetical protein